MTSEADWVNEAFGCVTTESTRAAAVKPNTLRFGGDIRLEPPGGTKGMRNDRLTKSVPTVLKMVSVDPAAIRSPERKSTPSDSAVGELTQTILQTALGDVGGPLSSLAVTSALIQLIYNESNPARSAITQHYLSVLIADALGEIRIDGNRGAGLSIARVINREAINLRRIYLLLCMRVKIERDDVNDALLVQDMNLAVAGVIPNPSFFEAASRKRQRAFGTTEYIDLDALRSGAVATKADILAEGIERTINASGSLSERRDFVAGMLDDSLWRYVMSDIMLDSMRDLAMVRMSSLALAVFVMHATAFALAQVCGAPPSVLREMERQMRQHEEMTASQIRISVANLRNQNSPLGV